MRATSSCGEKPASAKREMIESAESVIWLDTYNRHDFHRPEVSGIVWMSAGTVAADRPSMKDRRGDPGHVLRPTAAAKWRLGKIRDTLSVNEKSYRSPAERPCLPKNRFSRNVVI